ncbi:MAG: DCN1-like protein [Chitinispirillia bacterium]|nr:DCN1-like protein [Chitinispirillia bacterium]
MVPKNNMGIVIVKDGVMSKKYDLDELLETPDKPLTRDQWNNFERYMAMTNDDKPASEVDINAAIKRDIEDMRRKGTYWL